jgi:hypothetical protein
MSWGAVMTDDRFARQRDLLPPEKLAALKVTIIGAGAVGSFTCLTLAKMGVTDITVFDGDTIEEHNLPNQWYKPTHVGWNKTDALRDIIVEFTGVELRAHSHHYTHEPLTGIVICAVDTMDTRLLLWREVKKFKPDLYIDARMGVEVGKILVVNPADPASYRRYEEDLYPSSEALHAPCTAKATVYCAAGLGAFIGGSIAGYALGRPILSFVIDWTQARCDAL